MRTLKSFEFTRQRGQHDWEGWQESGEIIEISQDDLPSCTLGNFVQQVRQHAKDPNGTKLAYRVQHIADQGIVVFQYLGPKAEPTETPKKAPRKPRKARK